MANTKFRKSISSQNKGWIALAILLAITVFVACLAVGGMKLDKDGVKVLLPWVPTSSENWPDSLPLSRTLGGGTYTDYTVTLPEDESGITLEEASAQAEKLLKTRISKLNLSDAKVSRNGSVLTLELPRISDAEMQFVDYMAVKPARLEVYDSKNEKIMDESGIKKISYDNNGTSYLILVDVKDEYTEAINDADGISFLMDGENVTETMIVQNSTIKLIMGSDSNLFSNVAYLLENGSYQGNLEKTGEGELDASSSATALKVILIAAAVLLLAELIAAVVMGRLTGVAAFWAVLCAVIINLFFYATVVLTNMTVGVAVALIAGLVLVCAVLNMRVGAISKAVASGMAPKQAVKAASRASAKDVWLCQAAVLVISFILMLIPTTKPAGYTLASGVVACACGVGLMRVFLSCFTAISGKPALYCKAK